MEIKMKEKVNVNGFTFKKRVIEDSIELLGVKRNYVLNDIKFVAMIAFVNNLVENNLIIEILHDEKELESKMLDIVEPLFTQELVKEGYRESFNEIVDDIEDYMFRMYESNNTLAGMLYTVAESFGDTNIEELISVVKKLAEQNLFPNAKSITATSKVDNEVKAQSIDDVENVKMKALMEKYLGKTEEENITE